MAKEHLTKNSDDRDTTRCSISLLPLEWGNEQQITGALAAIPHTKAPDLLIACEVLHIPIFDLYADDMLVPVVGLQNGFQFHYANFAVTVIRVVSTFIFILIHISAA